MTTGSAFNPNRWTKWVYNDRDELTESRRFAGITVGDESSPVTNQQFVFGYDPIGNRTAYEGDGIEGALTYTANNLNQYTATSQPAESFQYDGNAGPPRNDGNLTQDGRYDYTYDAENRLSTVTPRSLLTGTRKVKFSYDYRNRRVRKQVWAASVDGPFGGTVTWVPTEDRRFIYDGWNLLMELDGRVEQTPPLTKFTWGLDLSGQNGNASVAGLHGAGGIGGLLAMTDTKGTSTEADDAYMIYFYDANGNVGQVIDARAGSAYFGQTAARYEYYPFGGNLMSAFARGTSGQKNPFMFSTKYRDSETGLYYSGYRYLLPRLGRWLNRDPIGERGGLNLYGSFVSSPSNIIDPLGREPAASQADDSDSARYRLRYGSDPSSSNSPPKPVSWRIDCTECKGDLILDTYRLNSSKGMARLEIRLAWKQDKSHKCCCDKIKWIQAVRVEPGTFRKQGRTATQPFIDPLEEEDDQPYYYSPEYSSTERPNQFYDEPRQSRKDAQDRKKRLIEEFEVCMICTQKDKTDLIMGCVYWGYSYDGDRMKDLAIDPVFRTHAPNDFFHGALRRDFPTYKYGHCTQRTHSRPAGLRR